MPSCTLVLRRKGVYAQCIFATGRRTLQPCAVRFGPPLGWLSRWTGSLSGKEPAAHFLLRSGRTMDDRGLHPIGPGSDGAAEPQGKQAQLEDASG